MKTLIPKKLQPGDHLRIIAPARSLSLLGDETIKIAEKNLGELGFKLSFGKYVKEMDDFASSSIKHRLEDLHEAFGDKSVDGILTVIGGFNSNQLLKYIDWEIIKNNPKVFCGYSDITALNNSIFAKTGLVNYSGPHFSTFGQIKHLEYTREYFAKMLMSEEEVVVEPSQEWFDDDWWLNQDDRKPMINTGHLVINEGQAQGRVLGGNLCTLNLLAGTKFMPDLSDTILFVEDDGISFPEIFDRDLQSLIHLPSFKGVRGLVIGRFQKASQMNWEQLEQIIKTKKELNNLPVIADVDFGHTEPKITLPIGGQAKILAREGGVEIRLT